MNNTPIVADVFEEEFETTTKICDTYITCFKEEIVKILDKKQNKLLKNEIEKMEGILNEYIPK